MNLDGLTVRGWRNNLGEAVQIFQASVGTGWFLAGVPHGITQRETRSGLVSIITF